MILRSREERLAFARSMNLFSTPFMREVFKDKAATEYVLRILTQKESLVIVENRTEYHIAKLASHDAILDVLATDENGEVFHIEIQLEDSDNHIARVRVYSAMVDSELLEKGAEYDQLPNAYLFYISKRDFMHLGEPISRLNVTVGSQNKPYDDGKYIYYVNAAVDDHSQVANLMNYFKLADPEDNSQGDLSKRVHLLKCEQEGEEAMCNITQSFFDEGKIAGYVEALRDSGEKDETISAIIMKKFHLNEYQAKTFIEGTKAVPA